MSRWCSARAGVQVGFGALGPDTQSGAGLFERGRAGISCAVQFVALALGVGADAGDLPGCPGLGALGTLDGGGIGLPGACGLLLGPAELAGHLGYLAGCLVTGLADFALCGVACLLDVSGGLVAELAELLVRGGPQGGQPSMRLIAWDATSSASSRSAWAWSRSASASRRRLASSASRVSAAATR